MSESTAGAPDEDGASVPFYVTRKPGGQQVCETPVTVAWPDQLQAHTAELACEVINTVTHLGYQFPGSSGPGAAREKPRAGGSAPARAAGRPGRRAILRGEARAAGPG